MPHPPFCLALRPIGSNLSTASSEATKTGAFAYVLQTNRRENFYQRDLEEKMVHKVTMDTVRIITSSVSGMTSVSEPLAWASPLCWDSALCLLRHVGMAETLHSYSLHLGL